jgi:prepilin-type N-terminal cleavage/methylation domain-containing protein
MVKREAGFTLVEVTLVMAISGALLLIAFAGQSKNRSNANFQAAMDKIVASINDARNQAASGVNVGGIGNGSPAVPAGCAPLGLTPPIEFAGTSWVAIPKVGSEGSTAGYIVPWIRDEIHPATCPIATSAVFTSVPVNLSVTYGGPSTPASGTKLPEIMYTRHGGGLGVCLLDDGYPVPNFGTASTDEGPGLGCSAGAGSVPSLTLTVQDTAGHTGTIKIDPTTGLAYY